jgi:hypothetical protein
VAWPPEESGTRVERPQPSLFSILFVVAALLALGVAVTLGVPAR